MSEIKFNKCPICGKEVEVHGGDIDWKPTFYDPDSGGDPYYIHCECGLEFSIGYCDIADLANAWNTRKPMERIVKKIKERQQIHKEIYDTNAEALAWTITNINSYERVEAVQSTAIESYDYSLAVIKKEGEIDD